MTSSASLLTKDLSQTDSSLYDSAEETDGYLDPPVRRSQSQASLRPGPGGAGGGAEQPRHQGEHPGQGGQGGQGGGLRCDQASSGHRELYCYS